MIVFSWINSFVLSWNNQNPKNPCNIINPSNQDCGRGICFHTYHLANSLRLPDHICIWVPDSCPFMRCTMIPGAKWILTKKADRGLPLKFAVSPESGLLQELGYHFTCLRKV